MGQKIKRSGLKDHLYSLQGLDMGSKDAIAVAKREYYKAYKNAWKRRQRVTTKQFLISLTHAEAKDLANAAKKHRLSKTRFIKQACFCYMQKRYLPTEPIVLAVIRQLLAQNLIALTQLKNSGLIPADTGIQVVAIMNNLERTIIGTLYHPKELNI